MTELEMCRHEVNLATDRMEKALLEKDVYLVEVLLDRVRWFRHKIKLLEGKTG